MRKLAITLFFILWSNISALITNITIFESGKADSRQLVIVCGDHHQLGSWEDNIIQFLGLAQLRSQSKLKILYLVENLSSPNEHFNRTQDLAILQEKEAYLLGNLMRNYSNPKPAEMPTCLHFWGCSPQFYEKLTPFLQLSPSSCKNLCSLPVINVDNRHRNVYYGESLIGWSFGPYDHKKVRAIQESESQSLTILDLLSPQTNLKQYFNSSTGPLHSIFDEILARQEFAKKMLFQQLTNNFNIREQAIPTNSLATIAGNRQLEFYRYLQKSPLETILREMVEANALWHISQNNANIIVVLAGTNHTGHTQGMWAHQTPGLVRYLSWLGYRETFDSSPTQVDLIRNRIELAVKLRSDVPNRIFQFIKKFNAEKLLQSKHGD